MYKICVFGGTTEGRELVEFLNTQPCRITACVATDYGQALLPESDRLTVSARRLPVGEIAGLLRQERFDLVIDATHPYAASISASIRKACLETGTETWRLLRGASAAPEDAVFVENTEKAVELLCKTEGNILLTTGSKELAHYAALPGFAERCWARVLPLPASLEACRAAGLPPAHILAMQGPFSEELNAALLRSTGARWLVTKDGGAAGGFAEKAAAAAQTGARLLVIGRPAETDGRSLEETVSALCARFSFRRRPEVSIVGLGPGAECAQTGEVREAIRTADCLIGAKRMLSAVAAPGRLCIEAIAPEAIADAIAAHPACARFAVIMSGDTGFFSGTKKLLPRLADCRVRVLPGLSSLSVLCARLGVSYEDVVPVSLHGRTHDIVSDVRRHARVFALVGGEDGMAALCRRLRDAGLGDVRVSVGERLSYPDEAVTCGTAAELCGHTFAPLSVALLENPAPSAVTPGLPDELFLRAQEPGHVVPMTKSEVRAVCLSKLALPENAVCWDVGAGTGSVSVEMALQAPKGRVYAIERNETALALIAANRASFGLENLEVICGTAPEACAGLPAPTHVFLGGTAGNLHAILQTALEKNPQVRIVAAAVTLESAAALTACMAEFSKAECVQVQVSRAKPAGPYHLMQAQNPVFLFTLQNGGEMG